MPTYSLHDTNGLLPIYKPKGLVSKDVSRILTRKFGKLTLGHVGTLDPLAEGVLPILLGKATRVQDYLLEMSKTYECVVELGLETDTLDKEGKVVKTLPATHVTKEQLLKACKSFMGPIKQIPPAFSAVKYKGQPLYKKVHQGKELDVDLESLSRNVVIYDLSLLDFSNGFFSFKVSCSKGTYVRVLAKDLCSLVGTCGTVSFLKRTSTAGISFADCLTLTDLEALNDEAFNAHVIPLSSMDIPLVTWTILDPALVTRLLHGQRIFLDKEIFKKMVHLSKTHLEKENNPVLLSHPSGERFGLGKVQLESEYARVSLSRKF